MKFLLALLAAAAASAAPQRVISTAPVITEILYALGAGDRVVGVTTYCHHPAEARTKPKIGTYVKPHMEAVLAQRPDLVIVIEHPGPNQKQLRDAGLNVLAIREGMLAATYENIQLIGDALGLGAKAKSLVQHIQGELEKVRRDVSARAPRSVMFIVGRTPGQLAGLMVVGRNSFLNELFTIAGGHNVFATTAFSYPRVTVEEVITRQPDVILDMGDMGQTEGVTPAQKAAVVALYQQHQVLNAVRAGRVHALASDVFMVAGPRVALAARELARLLHPEAFPR